MRNDHRRVATGRQLLHWLHMLAYIWLFPRRLFAPSGAQIFYCTYLALWRLGFETLIAPTNDPLPLEIVAVFLKTAMAIAEHLAADYELVKRLLANTLVEGPQVFAKYSAPHFAGLADLLADLQAQTGVYYQNPLARWDAIWKLLAGNQLPALVIFLNPDYVLIAPIAPAELAEEDALRLLKARLAEDTHLRAGAWPPLGMFLFEEPFLDWFARNLLAQPWFQGLW